MGHSVRMLRNAKEWTKGEVFVVRGASSNCWKVVGKDGKHHCAVNKSEKGKFWEWVGKPE